MATEINAQTQQMATQPNVQSQQVGQPQQGELCESCGAPLAADQRYCLNCGHRRGGPRVDYRHYMGPDKNPGSEPPKAGESPNGVVAGGPKEPDKRERDYAPLAAVGGIALLGLMLLVGVLIGKGNDSSAPAPAPVVVEGTGKSNTEGAEGTEGTEKEPTTGKKKGASAGGSTGSGANTVKGLGNGGGNSDATVEASKGELKSLESGSGESYEKESEKLPNKIVTEGAPPPIDKSKAPGGSSAGEAITIE